MFKEMMKRMKKNEKGFTLVELMVVVVIIGVLVAIAVPVYKNSTEKAETNACYANQRMIEGAMTQYEMDNLDEKKKVENLSDLAGYFKGGVPDCPNGGEYTIEDGLVKCGNHKHYATGS